MRSLLLLLLLPLTPGLLAQTQPDSPSAQPPAAGSTQPSAAAPQQSTPEQQAPTQQMPSQQDPANQPSEAAPHQNSPGAPPSAEAGPSQEQTNVAAVFQVYAYPKANQTPEKQAQDESECSQWAQGQGVETPPQGTQQGQQQDSSKAETGAMVKSSAGDAGTGAAGDPVDTAAREQHKKKAQQQPQEQHQQQAQLVHATDNVKRAYSACMQSRNYTVK